MQTTTVKAKKIKKNIFPPCYFNNLKEVAVDSYYYQIASSTCILLFSSMENVFFTSGIDLNDLQNICRYYTLSYFNKYSITNNDQRLAEFLDKRKNLIEVIKNNPEKLKKLERNKLIAFLRQAIYRVWTVSKRTSVNIEAVKDRSFQDISEMEAMDILKKNRIDIENKSQYSINHRAKDKVSLTIFENRDISNEYTTVYTTGLHHNSPEDALLKIEEESQLVRTLSGSEEKMISQLTVFIDKAKKDNTSNKKQQVRLANNIISKLKNGTFRSN